MQVRARARTHNYARGRDVTPARPANEVTWRDLDSCSGGRETETDDRLTPSSYDAFVVLSGGILTALRFFQQARI